MRLTTTESALESMCMQMKKYHVYIMASKRNGTLYIGVTSNFARRVYEHKNGMHDGFTKKYKVKSLVYYEGHADKKSTQVREEQMKKWNRQWKMRLIDRFNPQWKDLYDSISG